MIIDGKIILLAGANRDLGSALVQVALDRGAARVYAAQRQVYADVSNDDRIVPIRLDLTGPAQIRQAVGSIDRLDVLMNTARISAYQDLSRPLALEQVLAVNLTGTLGVTGAVLPRLSEVSGAVANITSLDAFAAIPLAPSYPASTAALADVTQVLRTVLATYGVSVHAVLSGLVDTGLNAGFGVAKPLLRQVAAGIFDGLERDEQAIIPGGAPATTTAEPRHEAPDSRRRRGPDVYAYFA
jgi:NAD(P)-dependent dehydrogenase (short-subunit alcohol dehydrogenase family)